MDRIKNISWTILRITGFTALFVFLVASFSDRISPYTCIWLSYLGLFFPFIFLVNIVFFIFFLIGKKWKTVLVFLAVFFICYGSIHSYFPVHFKTKKLPENCIKILTYNVMRFDDMKKQTKKPISPIVQYIADCDADIICIQEYASNAVDRKKSLTDEDLFSAFKSTPYKYIEHLKAYSQTVTYGLAIFSKYPILKTKTINYDSQNNGSFLTELDINGKKVTLINNHLESNKLSEEDRTEYYELTNNISSENLESFTHLMFNRLTPAFKTRALQSQQISEIISKNKNPYLIVCGDFNDTPISYTHHKIKGKLHDAFVESGCGLGITYNKHRFLFRIDYILHSDNIKSYNCTIGKLKNSDHYPMWCYLELKD